MDLATFTAKYGSSPTVYKMDKTTNQIVETIPLQFDNPTAAFEFVRGLEVNAPNSHANDLFYFTHDPVNRRSLASPLTLVTDATWYGYDKISPADYDQMTDKEKQKLFRFVRPSRGGFRKYDDYEEEIQAWLKKHDLPHKFVMVNNKWFKYSKNGELVLNYHIKKIRNDPADPVPERANFEDYFDYTKVYNE